MINLDMTTMLTYVLALLMAACEGLMTAPQATVVQPGSAAANLTAAYNAWQATKVPSVATAVNNDPANVPINRNLQNIATYSDPTINPMTALTSDGTTTYEQSVQAIIASSVSVPIDLITTLNDTSDIAQSNFTSMNVNFSYADPLLFNVSLASLGSNYTSYAGPGTKYSNLVQ